MTASRRPNRRLIMLRRECTEGTACACVSYDPVTDDLFMRGYVVTDPEILAELNLPPGEIVSRIPARVIPELGPALSELRKDTPSC